MGVELVNDKNPRRFGVSFNRVGNVIGKIQLGASGADRRSNHLSLGNLPVSNQALGAMTDILAPPDVPPFQFPLVESDEHVLTPGYPSSHRY